LEKALSRRDGFIVRAFADASTALEQYKTAGCDIVITDMKMPGMSGLDFLKAVHAISPDLPVIVMTAYGTVENAVEAMKSGAVDYLTKPFSIDELDIVMNKVLSVRRLVNENEYLKEVIGEKFNFGTIVGTDPAMRRVYELIRKVAPSDATVLIQGESGTGKELVARALHYNSKRASGPFIKVNCAALASNLLESELFGHEKGSFTNAFQKKLGRFELADKGTLLLDEISEMEPMLQAKLLRVLQEGEFDRVGGTSPVKTDVRIVATTNRVMHDEIKNGKFRLDLFYRLNVVPVVLPPLRERLGDVRVLIEHFKTKYNTANGKKISRVSESAMRLLTKYHWAGNVRELENTIERAVVLCSGQEITEEHLLFDFDQTHGIARTLCPDIAGVSEPAAASVAADRDDIKPLYEIEKEAILKTLAYCKNNKTKAAQLLGITARTMRNKLHEFALESSKSVDPENISELDGASQGEPVAV
jgi:DNA-binding NtrC family response regulator